MDGIEEEVRAFEAELAEIERRARTCVERFRTTADPDLQYLLAERLSCLGSLVAPDLQATLDDPDASGRLRYLTAWVALRVGDRGTSLEVLCAEVERGTEWSLPAANALACARVEAGGEVINRVLERIDTADEWTVVGYLTALRDLGGTLGPAARDRLAASDSPRIVRVVLEDFPVRPS